MEELHYAFLDVVVLAQGGGQLAEVASTFGVDWPHLLAQVVSFSVVCAVLWTLAYKPILKMLAARREQIATGLANAAKIKAELARIEVERRAVLAKADAEGRQLIEDARAAATRLQADETRKAVAMAEQIMVARARGGGTRAGTDAGRGQARGRPARGSRPAPP